MDMNQATAAAIAAERAIAGVTVRQLAVASHIPERSLMRVLQAERDIKVNQVAVIAEALSVYPHELIQSAEAILAREGRGPVILLNPEVDTPSHDRPHGGSPRRRAPRPNHSAPEA